MPPQDILDAARTIPAGASRHQVDLIPDWIGSEAYLSWAKESLARGDEFGWDAAVCYAKRAVCRQIDAFMLSNHLARFIRRDYPTKMEMLSELGVPVPEIIHELVIDPRNDIEHAYGASSADRAKRAVQLAELFLRSTAGEATQKADISIGWSISIQHEACDAPGKNFDCIDFTLRRESPSMLLIDVSGNGQPTPVVEVNAGGRP